MGCDPIGKRKLERVEEITDLRDLNLNECQGCCRIESKKKCRSEWCRLMADFFRKEDSIQGADKALFYTALSLIAKGIRPKKKLPSDFFESIRTTLNNEKINLEMQGQLRRTSIQEQVSLQRQRDLTDECWFAFIRWQLFELPED